MRSGPSPREALTTCAQLLAWRVHTSASLTWLGILTEAGRRRAGARAILLLLRVRVAEVLGLTSSAGSRGRPALFRRRGATATIGIGIAARLSIAAGAEN
jgi:hypothetical protein